MLLLLFLRVCTGNKERMVETHHPPGCKYRKNQMLRAVTLPVAMALAMFSGVAQSPTL